MSGATATFVIAATWDDLAQVPVAAACVAEARALECDLEVDDDAWTVVFARESADVLAAND